FGRESVSGLRRAAKRRPLPALLVLRSAGFQKGAATTWRASRARPCRPRGIQFVQPFQSARRAEQPFQSAVWWFVQLRLAGVPRQIRFGVLIMKNYFRFLHLLAVSAALPLFAADHPEAISADQVVTQMVERDAQRQSSQHGYYGMRRYSLQNDHLHKHAE